MPSQIVRVDMVQAISELLLDEQAPLMMRWMRDMSEDPDVLDDDISVNLLLSLPFYDIASDELHFAFEVTGINSEINNRRRKLLDNDPLQVLMLEGSSNHHAKTNKPYAKFGWFHLSPTNKQLVGDTNNVSAIAYPP